MSNNKKGKKTALKVIGIIFLVIVVVVCAFAYRYRSHIKAAVIWLTTSEEDIQKNIENAKNQQTEILNSVGFYANEEADAALTSGEITAEQHTQILLGNLTLDEIRNQNGEDTQNSNSPDVEISDEIQTENESDTEQQDENSLPDVSNTDAPQTGDEKQQPISQGNKEEEKSNAPPVSDTPVPADKETNPQVQVQPQVQTSEVDTQIAQLVTKMYVLKAEYTGAVEGIVSSMKADYVKLPPEQRTKSAKQSIATGYMSQINAMETQCDAQVNAIVSELKQILKDNGRDMSLVEAILSTYATEKENTKAYYLSTYGD